MEDSYEDGGEINNIIHEGRAQKRGLTWNREKQRYEHDGKPVIFTDYKGTWREATEAEWDSLWIKHIE